MGHQTLQALTERITAFRDARDWKQFHRPKDMMLSLMIEASELAEHFQWKSDQELAHLQSSQREKMGEELADVLYWVLLLSHDLGIELSKSFEEKMEKNELKYPEEACRGRSDKYTLL